MPETSTPLRADDPDRLIGYAELSEWTDVPERSVRAWVSSGTGPTPIRLGRHVRFRVRDVLAWLDQKASATAAASQHVAPALKFRRRRPPPPSTPTDTSVDPLDAA